MILQITVVLFAGCDSLKTLVGQGEEEDMTSTYALLALALQKSSTSSGCYLDTAAVQSLTTTTTDTGKYTVVDTNQTTCYNQSTGASIACAGTGFRNFNQFLNSYRIHEACRVLADPAMNDQTVLRIAFDLGFASLAPFNLAFKRITGTTPTKYRKSILQEHKASN
ncbi:MAG: AraC family transcriptional regulator [Leptospiraceae bacterium]|nr:AraC family transcriptional regulator [Leptospiraceae bacterium]